MSDPAPPGRVRAHAEIFENLASTKVLGRTDDRTWATALMPIVSDTARPDPSISSSLAEVSRLVDLLLDEISRHPLPAYVVYASPTDKLDVTPTAFASATVSHRAERLIQAAELAAGALDGLERGALQLSAVATRALFELAVVCRDIHQPLLEPWRSIHGSVSRVRAAASSDTTETFRLVWQTRTASRFYDEEQGWPVAKSVLTRLGRLIKVLPSAREIYDMLCDATHPNVESHATLWRTEYVDLGDYHGIRLAPGHSNSVIKTYIVEAVRLSLLMIIPFCRDLWWVAADITNTCNITPNDRTLLLGLPARTGRNELCSCGFGLVTRVCTHPEPELPSDEELGRTSPASSRTPSFGDES